MQDNFKPLIALLLKLKMQFKDLLFSGYKLKLLYIRDGPASRVRSVEHFGLAIFNEIGMTRQENNKILNYNYWLNLKFIYIHLWGLCLLWQFQQWRAKKVGLAYSGNTKDWSIPIFKMLSASKKVDSNLWVDGHKLLTRVNDYIIWKLH